MNRKDNQTENLNNNFKRKHLQIMMVAVWIKANLKKSVIKNSL